jgi:porphobilinogen synthase
MEPLDRPRRLRTDGIRPLVSETTVKPADLVAPVFVDATLELLDRIAVSQAEAGADMIVTYFAEDVADAL